MKTRRTKEEKFRLIADYKSSGLTMTKWCKKNDIPASTLAGWIRNGKAHDSTLEKKAKFVEVSFSTEPVMEKKADIVIECKDIKVIVPAGADSKSVENVLRVVTQLNV